MRLVRKGRVRFFISAGFRLYRDIYETPISFP